MIKGKLTYYLLGIIIVIALLLKIISFFNSDTVSVKDKIVEKEKIALESQKATGSPEKIEIIPEPVKVNPEPIKNNPEIIINNPQPGEIISSPLVITGQAKGAWFFEATLPIRLLDDKGNIIASTFAQAEGDWMTENLVPFKSLLDFKTEATSGYLLISKDNPSGLPEHDASVRISVKFLNK